MTRSFRTSPVCTLMNMTDSRASFPKTQDAVFPHSRPAWAARIKSANKKMTNFSRVNQRLGPTPRVRCGGENGAYEHWSCSHCDDYIWEICCIYLVCHMMTSYRRMPLLQSKHINSLIARTDSYTYKKARPSRSQIPRHYLTYARRKSKLHA